MVVDVSYISKEHSEDATQASSGVTGILAVQGAFAEHAAMLDRLGAPWKLLPAREDFDDSIDRVILPGGESTTQGKLLRSTGLFDPINEHIKAGKPVFGTCAGMILLAQRLENRQAPALHRPVRPDQRAHQGRQAGVRHLCRHDPARAAARERPERVLRGSGRHRAPQRLRPPTRVVHGHREHHHIQHRRHCSWCD